MANPIRTITDQQPPAFGFNMTDNGAVVLGMPVGPGALSFTDAGYMPITALTIDGDPQRLRGNPDSLFIKYSAQGVQHFAPDGVPTTADYTSLHFELVGYKGNGSFGRAPEGTATFSGGKHLTVLAQGDLIMGQLGFNAMGRDHRSGKHVVPGRWQGGRNVRPIGATHCCRDSSDSSRLHAVRGHAAGLVPTAEQQLELLAQPALTSATPPKALTTRIDRT